MGTDLNTKLHTIVTDAYNDARKQMDEYKKQLPDELKGFVDLHFKSLERAKEQLTKDADFYVFGKWGDDQKIKSFKIHCVSRFLGIVMMAEPKNIESYGITYQEYITPQKEH